MEASKLAAAGHNKPPSLIIRIPFYRKAEPFARGRMKFVDLYKKTGKKIAEKKVYHSRPAVVRMRSTSSTRRGHDASAARSRLR